VLEALRARIEDVDPKIDAYLSLDFEAALKEARKRMSICTRRRADCDQGFDQRCRTAMHVRLENPARLSRSVRRHRDP